MIKLTGSLAVLFELAAAALLVDFRNGTGQVLLFLALHMVSAALLALTALPLLPARYRTPRLQVLALLFSFGFFIPLLGILGLMVALAITALRPRSRPHEPFAEVRPPEYVLSIPDPEIQFRPAGLRATLLDATLPTELRMRSLIALQNMPTRIAAPTLRRLLGDPVDDIRLVAYGILDQKEKAINDQIQENLGSLEGLANLETRVNALRHLAELHWELIYAGLVTGDVRAFTLERVLDYTGRALDLSGQDPGLWLLRGRALHARRELDAAAEAYQHAVQGGLPEQRVLPYQAEIAYDRRDLADLRSRLERLAGAGRPTPAMAALIRYWSREAA
jgi:hypothetical protein